MLYVLITLKMEAWQYYQYQCMVMEEQFRRKRIAAVGLALIRLRREKNRRKVWVRRWIEKRNEGRGVLNMVHNELRLQDSDSFRNYLRMDEALFNELLERITPRIRKQNTVMREAVSPQQRLAATLRFLATGNTFRDLSFSVRIADNTLSGIVPETLEAIIEELEGECIKAPTSDNGWKQVEEGYRVLWNYPHCIGALDGKHINFRPARSQGSRFRNYKGRDSIVLLALVDATYKFLYIDVGRNGRMHDANVFLKSSLHVALNRTQMFLPAPSILPGDVTNVPMPYVITADEAFPMSMHLMKPYPSRGLTHEQRIYNYRHSRARRVVENAFGMLANRFRVLLTTINLNEEKVCLITRACCVLHNFILTRKPAPLQNVGGEHTVLDENMQCALGPIVRLPGNNASERVKAVREHFKEYFNGVGAVAWQHEAVLRGNY